MLRKSASILVFVLCAALVSFAQPSGKKRSLTPDDLSRLEGIGEASYSPDGAQLAVVISRPMNDSKFYRIRLDGEDRSDIWVANAAGGDPVNITNGAAEGVGFFHPLWSPDGARLAMYSTKGGNVRVWMWDKATQKLQRLTEDGSSTWLAEPTWIDATHLLVPVLPKGAVAQVMDIDYRANQIASKEWPKAWSGHETTASVMESGVPSEFAHRPHGRLLKVDVASGDAVELIAGDIDSYFVSRDARYVSALRQTDIVRPEEGVPLAHMDNGEYSLSITGLGNESVHFDSAELKVLPRTIRWSPNSREVAFYGWKGKPWATPTSAFCFSIDSGKVEQLNTDEIRLFGDSYEQIPGLTWTKSGQLLVLASVAHSSEGKADWFLLSKTERPQNESSSLKEFPHQFVPLNEGDSVGLTAGKLWEIEANGHLRELPVTGLSASSAMVWPAPIGWLAPPSPGRLVPADFAIVSTPENENSRYDLIDITSGAVKPVQLPEKDAKLTAFNSATRSAVIVANNESGSRMWTSGLDKRQSRLLLSRNQFLAEIEEGQMKEIEYVSLDGKPLKGWLILPPNYDPSKKYPLVADIYPGSSYSDVRPSLTSIAESNRHNYQLLAAHDYVVLLPSMPLPPEGTASDPYLELIKGVIPAVDKAIALGIADQDRVGVMGQSYGGYGTYGLITQTKRFKAAVVKAGLSDLVSLYGLIDPRYRYDAHPEEDIDYLFYMSIAESGQTRMGGAPWQYAERFVRNSPLFYADRVETPLLITQGDLDYVGMNQGEEFFNALYRQGKRARFVRYWGEGHSFASPANIGNQWYEIYNWFDQFLDVSRTEHGDLVWDGVVVKSRGGSSAFKP